MLVARENLDELRHDVCVYDRLDLVAVAGSDVRDGPACFLCDRGGAVVSGGLWNIESVSEAREAAEQQGRAGLADLSNRALRADKECQETREGAKVDHDLGLKVIARDDVAHGAESRCLNGRRVVAQELHKTPAHASLNDSLNLVVGT